MIRQYIDCRVVYKREQATICQIVVPNLLSIKKVAFPNGNRSREGSGEVAPRVLVRKE